MQIPDAWSKYTRTSDDEPFEVIDIADNQITGDVPISLKGLERTLQWLHIKSNPGLTGCVPLSAFTTITLTGTRVAGRCITSSERAQIHNTHRAALRSHFKAAFGVGAEPEVTELITTVVNDAVTTLGRSVKPGQLSRTYQQFHPSGEESGKCMITISLLDGIEYVTDIDVKQGGLNMTRLAMLFATLPKLRTLGCTDCNRAPQGSQRLPPVLPSLVPELALIYMPDCGLVGPFPSTCGAFANLSEVFLINNQLSGQLPPELADMKSLVSLRLDGNMLKGEAPLLSVHERCAPSCVYATDMLTSQPQVSPCAFASSTSYGVAYYQRINV
jgi:hypothetical protein